MATLTPKLTLASTDVSANEVLGLSVGKALTVKPPMKGISRISCPAAAGGNGLELVTASGSGVVQYIYIHHTGFEQDGTTSNTQSIDVKFGSGPLDCVTLHKDDFVFMPVENQAITIESSGNKTILTEYAYWTKA
tara:strand:+ start:79 stop:483 length:405 start_codon:yes stop_codon:yes gene_type:complete